MIILTAEQADQVRGLTTEGHALAPVPLADGTFVLGEECMADPAHAKHRDVLKGLPTREVAEDEYLRWKLGDDERASTATVEDLARLQSSEFRTDWEVGKPVAVSGDAKAKREVT